MPIGYVKAGLQGKTHKNNQSTQACKMPTGYVTRGISKGRRIGAHNCLSGAMKKERTKRIVLRGTSKDAQVSG